MAAPIPPMLKYSIVYNLLSFPPILIKFVPKFIVCKVLYFKAHYILRLRSPLNIYKRLKKKERKNTDPTKKVINTTKWHKHLIIVNPVKCL